MRRGCPSFLGSGFSSVEGVLLGLCSEALKDAGSEASGKF